MKTVPYDYNYRTGIAFVRSDLNCLILKNSLI